MAKRAVAKVKIHQKGGAKNALYIGGLRDELPREPDHEVSEQSLARSEGDDLQIELREDDERIWGWNVPYFIADDGYGAWETEEGRALLESYSLTLSAQHMGLCPPPPSAEKIVGAEKRENLVAHFSAMAELEERRQQGLSHLRIILTVGLEVTDQELRVMGNDFMRENFILCSGFGAIHRDTRHAHLHLYIHARQLNELKLELKQEYFRLDESWMKICAEGLGAPEIYDIHLDLKDKTEIWKEQCEKARVEGKDLPPKPDRWADHHDTLLSFRPFDDRWCGRLRAQTRVAEMKVVCLEATRAKAEDVAAARTASAALRERLDLAAERRLNSKRETKRQLPPEIITVQEARELKGFERELHEIEKARETHSRKIAVPDRQFTQSVLNFDEPGAGPRGQMDFDFKPVPDQDQSDASTQRPSLNVPGVFEGERETKELLPSMMRDPIPSAADAARILGRELVTEARRTFIEDRLKTGQSGEALSRLQEGLAESRLEHAQAHQEAEHCRATLASQNLSEPPYQLELDERNYLASAALCVPEALRTRILYELARAYFNPVTNDIPVRVPESSAPQKEVGHQLSPDLKPDHEPERKQPATNIVEHPKSTILAREDGTAGDINTPPLSAGPSNGTIAQTLPDEEVRRLLVAAEMADGRAAVLRFEERCFAVMPHFWKASAQDVTLAEVELKIQEAIEQKKSTERLTVVRSRVRADLAVEREQLPLRRQEAEIEASALAKQLSHEVAERKHVGLEMPVAEPTVDELSELTRNAVAAHDPQLLKQVFELELSQALRDEQQQGGGTEGKAQPLRSLEEKLVGLEFMALIREHQSQRILSEALSHPEKLALPAKDGKGHEIVRTLAQLGGQKGVTKLFKKITEGKTARGLREQVITAQESYLKYLRADYTNHTAFYEAAQEMASECRTRTLQFGYHTKADPSLTPEDIAEARTEANLLPSPKRDLWFAVVTRAQHAADIRDKRTVFVPETRGGLSLPSPAEEQWRESIRKQLEEERERMERSKPIPVRKALTREPLERLVTHERVDQSSPKKTEETKGSRSR